MILFISTKQEIVDIIKMDQFEKFWSFAVDALWGLPLVIFILITGIYFSYISGLRPLSGFVHAFSILFGKFVDLLFCFRIHEHGDESARNFTKHKLCRNLFLHTD